MSYDPRVTADSFLCFVFGFTFNTIGAITPYLKPAVLIVKQQYESFHPHQNTVVKLPNRWLEVPDGPEHTQCARTVCLPTPKKKKEVCRNQTNSRFDSTLMRASPKRFRTESVLGGGWKKKP